MIDKMLKEQIERGKADALALRNAAPTMTDGELIASITRIPKFNPTKDYSTWAVGSPVKELVDGEYKVFRLLVPHDAADHNGTPSALTELWAMCVEEKVEVPTVEERIAELERANAANEEYIANIDDALIQMYEMMAEADTEQ